MTKVSRDVDAREKELTHLVHRDILVRCLDSVKTMAPILICGMKIFVQLLAQGNYLLINLINLICIFNNSIIYRQKD